MGFPKTLLLLAFVVTIVLSVAYGKQQEGFMDAGTGVAIAIGILGVVLMAVFFFGVKPEKALSGLKLKIN